MEPLIDARITDWIATLNERFAETGKQMDFAPWAVFVAYDIISEVGFGEPFGFIKQGIDVSGLIQGFHDGLVSLLLPTTPPPFFFFLVPRPASPLQIEDKTPSTAVEAETPC